ncbi:MAG: hypothetical protein ACRENE_12720 [Polyangiaceae bacterium]
MPRSASAADLDVHVFRAKLRRGTGRIPRQKALDRVLLLTRHLTPPVVELSDVLDLLLLREGHPPELVLKARQPKLADQLKVLC